VNPYTHVFAVVRHNLSRDRNDIGNAVTIVAVVPTADEAKREVERLSRVNANKRVEYFWQSARYYSEGRDASDEDS